MPSPSRTTVALVLAGAAVLGVALLARPATSSDPATVEAVRASLAATTPAVAAPDPPGPLPPGRTVVRVEGVDGFRLGATEAELVAAGWRVGTTSYRGCRRVLPGLADTGPGPGTAGWLVADRLASVTVDSRAGEGSSFLGPGIGGRLSDLDARGLLRGTTTVAVPWQEQPQPVDVAWLRPEAGTRVAFADLDADGRTDHVQVRRDAAAGCAQAYEDAEAEVERGLPPVDLQGRGPVRVGMPLQEAADLVGLVDAGAAQGGRGTAQGGPGAAGPRCRLVLADDEPGLLYVVASVDRSEQEVVRALTVDAGSTEAGLRIGDPPAAVGEAYPGITTAYLTERWRQGLSADWQVDGGTLRLWPGREEVRVSEVDAVLPGPRDVVGLVQVGPGC